MTALASLPKAFAGSAADVDIEVYAREDERFAWRLRHRNGEILATDGGQGYEHRRFGEVVGDRIAAGYRVAALSEAHLVGVFRNAIGHSLGADRDEGDGIVLTDAETELSERITLRVIGDLFEIMGRERPNLIG